MGQIRATDDEALAKRLWPGAHHWDDELGQYVPDAGALDDETKPTSPQPEKPAPAAALPPLKATARGTVSKGKGQK